MVQTRAFTRKSELGQVHDNGGVTQSSPVNEQPKPSKRRRRGKPVQLCRLNLDVLFLIAAFIHPIDLLNLARTCKSLRELLISKASEFVWKTARRQIRHLPDCPADLTEPEYANLVFYARCHGCGKYTKTILWRMRRRYCPDCRRERLCPLPGCGRMTLLFRYEHVLNWECLTVAGHTANQWVDKAQLDEMLKEYDHSSNQIQFVKEKQARYFVIERHAFECEYWEKMMASERRDALKLRRKDRENGIFSRLKEHGFEPEIEYFDRYTILDSRRLFFKTSRSLTDKEWAQMWPKWLETMNEFRFRRLDETVYRSRRDLLWSEYASYVSCPSPGTPAFDHLPHVGDLAHFPPFRDIIQAPEETRIGGKPFESAFAQLPDFVDEWRERLDSELAKMVEIPSHLSSDGPSTKGRILASSGTTHKHPSHGGATDKLHLASAMFVTNLVFTYPAVLHFMQPHKHPGGKGDLHHRLSVQDRFNIKFLQDAPYIVYACGLDPNVATVEDMDRRNARLKCLECRGSRVWNWTAAADHARSHHNNDPVPSSGSTRWQAVGDEHMDAMHAAELSIKKESSVGRMKHRCLLCRPRMGDVMMHDVAVLHLKSCHSVEEGNVQLGTHYIPVGFHDMYTLEMVEEQGRVTFRDAGFRGTHS